MIKQLGIWGVLLVSLSVCSCTEREREEVDVLGNCPIIASRVVTAQGDTVVSCRVVDVKETITLPLSDIVDSLEIIKLDNRDEALIGSYALLVGNRYIGARYVRQPYKLFTRQGQFVCDVGTVGQGPGEYTTRYTTARLTNNTTGYTCFLGRTRRFWFMTWKEIIFKTYRWPS